MAKDFFRGFFSIFNIFPDSDGRDEFAREKFKIKIMSDEEAFKSDALAIRSDWEAVGSCLQWASKEIGNDSNRRR